MVSGLANTFFLVVNILLLDFRGTCRNATPCEASDARIRVAARAIVKNQ